MTTNESIREIFFLSNFYTFVSVVEIHVAEFSTVWGLTDNNCSHVQPTCVVHGITGEKNI